MRLSSGARPLTRVKFIAPLACALCPSQVLPFIDPWGRFAKTGRTLAPPAGEPGQLPRS